LALGAADVVLPAGIEDVGEADGVEMNVSLMAMESKNNPLYVSSQLKTFKVILCGPGGSD
jgi:hypothetical protein